MKKKGMILSILGVMLLGGPMVAHSSTGKQVTAILANYLNIEQDGRQLDTQGSDPILYQGRTYLPVRAISEALGYEINYQAETNTVSLMLPEESYPLVENDNIAIQTVTGAPKQYKELEFANHHHRGLYEVAMNIEIKENLNQKASVLIEVLDSKKDVVAYKLGLLEDTAPGLYTYEFETDSFRIPVSYTDSNDEAFQYLQENYTYRVTIK